MRDVQCNTNKSPSMINFLLTYSVTQKWCSLLINLKKNEDNDDDDYDPFCPYTVASYLQNTAGFPLQNILIHT